MKVILAYVVIFAGVLLATLSLANLYTKAAPPLLITVPDPSAPPIDDFDLNGDSNG